MVQATKAEAQLWHLTVPGQPLASPAVLCNILGVPGGDNPVCPRGNAESGERSAR